jgi:hypothetical protein
VCCRLSVIDESMAAASRIFQLHIFGVRQKYSFKSLERLVGMYGWGGRRRIGGIIKWIIQWSRNIKIA